MQSRSPLPADDILLVYNDIESSARAGSRLLDAILAAGFDHRHICGGHGFCTSCRVEIVEGAENISPVSALERDRLGPRAGELRLACQVVIRGPVRVRVPAPISSGFSPFEDESEQ